MKNKPRTELPSTDEWKKLTRIVNIHTYTRGGSGLMSALLDGHPKTISFPDVALMGYAEWWNSLKEHESRFVAEDFLDLYHFLFDPSYVHPHRLVPGCGNIFGITQNFTTSITEEGISPFAIPRDKFVARLFELLEPGATETASDFFKKLHISLAWAIGVQIHEDTVIIHAPHIPSEDRIQFIRDGFTDIKNLHMVREPVFGIMSWWKSDVRHGQSDTYPEVHLMIRWMEFNYYPQRDWDECSRAIRLDDLHIRPRETMELILKWLSLPWDECVLNATFLGRTWQFDTSRLYTTPFNPEIVSPIRHADVLDSDDHYRLALPVHHIYRAWNYEIPSKPRLSLWLTMLFRPLKVETRKNSSIKSKWETRCLLFPRLFLPYSLMVALGSSFIKRNEKEKLSLTLRRPKMLTYIRKLPPVRLLTESDIQ